VHTSAAPARPVAPGIAAERLERGSGRAETSALGCAAVLLVLVAACVATAYPSASPLAPDHRASTNGWAWAYVAIASAAFVAYVAGLLFVRRGALRLRTVVAVAVTVQVVPLAGPLLLSTDAYTYWDYGRLAAVHGANPYVDEPGRFPADPAYRRMGSDWHGTTSVYGPGFTLASEGHALVARESPAAAAWLYRGVAAAAMIVLVGCAALLGGAFAAAFVGWNPLLAFHFAGGGHNDVWMMALVLVALAAAASKRRELAGVAWACAIAVKWVAVVFLPLRALEARHTGREVRHLGFALAAVVLGALATWRYGSAWLGPLGPLAGHLERQSGYSVPNRIADLGISETAAAWLFAALFALAYLWLLREARRGRARLGLAAGLLLVATPWLAPWYAVWVVPLAAVEEDRLARWLAIAMSAYLLRDTVPL
jgi:hypothetical protein